MNEQQLKSLRQDWWGYFVAIDMTVPDEESVGRVFDICNDLGIDYRTTYSWIPGKDGAAHELNLIVDNALEEPFRAAIAADADLSAKLVFGERDPADDCFRRPGAPRNAVPTPQP